MIISEDQIEICYIHSCPSKYFKGNKTTAKINLPDKCKENICTYYATYFGTCVKTGDKCTACDTKQKYKAKQKPSSIKVGDSIKYVDPFGLNCEIIVLAQDVGKVTFLDIKGRSEKERTVKRPMFISIRTKIRMRRESR